MGILFFALQELDVGTNHTQWQTLAGTTGLAGNRQILSFTDAGENAEAHMARRLSLSAASAFRNSQVEVLRCDERASSLLVGVRLALWRRRKACSSASLESLEAPAVGFLQAAGLAAACAAWAQAWRALLCTIALTKLQVERIIAWDSEAHEELEPEVASMELDGWWHQGSITEVSLRSCTHAGDRRQLHGPCSHQRLREMGQLPGVARKIKEKRFVALGCLS